MAGVLHSNKSSALGFVRFNFDLLGMPLPYISLSARRVVHAESSQRFPSPVEGNQPLLIRNRPAFYDDR